jgi:hypothetical protein
MLALLEARASEATVCPSEVARALANSFDERAGWRDLMPLVHAAVDRLAEEGAVALSWKGKALERRAGPYRIGRPPPR